MSDLINLEDSLWQHIFDKYLPGESPHAHDRSLNLIENGILDSLAIMQLASHIEHSYGVRLGPQDFSVQNFSTVGAIASLIRSKK